MAAVSKIDSNVTGLRIAEESTIGVLPGTPVWVPFEPNSYADFGGELTLLARNPINASRQRRKGVITDLDASGGFNIDMLMQGVPDLLQGFMYAAYRKKGNWTDVGAVTSSTYALTATAGFFVGSLVYAEGMGLSANNGLKRVTTVTANTSLTVAETLSAEANAPATSTLEVVGHQFASGDANVDVTGNYAAITTTTKDLTELGLLPGEWVFVSGDQTAEQFGTAANNGWKRVKSVAANRLTFDKSAAAMVNETATGKTIRIYYGRVLKNETGSNIVRKTYQIERTLGAPDDASPSQIQSEYLTGSVASEAKLNVSQADKLNWDFSYVSLDNEQRTGATGVKSGTRPALVDSDAFNTSSDFSRIKVAVVSSANEAPTPLVAYFNELTLTINNNLTANKAVAVLGSFEVTAGTFQVSAELTGYFADVASVTAVRNNSDVTLDMVVAKANTGFAIDMPLVALGNGRLEVAQDEPIKVPLGAEAATAAKLDPAMDHTLLMCFYKYLPTVAET